MSPVWVVTTVDAEPSTLASARVLMASAFGDRFDDRDWAHALGGWHALVENEGEVVAHAALVPRLLHIDGVAVNAGYVEAVATAPRQQRTSLGTLVMEAIGDVIRREFELGALSTSAHHFYERIGWRRWHGASFVRAPDQLRRTEDEDDGIMVLLCGMTTDLDLRGSISCDTRPGDDW
jgi:aminoglycoside 2'-N-acetyltransferase I